MLEVRDLRSGYAGSTVLQGVDLVVQRGEAVALLGRNGSGRSTLARALMGLQESQGERLWRGESLRGLPPHRVARLGLGYVPESRDIFPGLTVRQNLLLGLQPQRRTPRWTLQDSWRMFPALQAREHTAAGRLSGGEQQMLTLCRTLVGDPDLVIVDEPAEGLAPQLVDRLARCLADLHARGLALLLIEQKLALALTVCQRCLVMGRGTIVFNGSPRALREREDLRQEWLGL
ncbi:MAG: ABC transporter ATP-binding protein [Rhodoferax sp.]|nr:ABC transporter ATP-binding protein [Rhodoferax sp.]